MLQALFSMKGDFMPAFQGSGSLSSILTALVLASIAGCSSGASDAEQSASNASAMKKIGVDDGPKETTIVDAGKPDTGKDAGGKKWGDLAGSVFNGHDLQVLAPDCTPAPPTGWRVRSDTPCTTIAAPGGNWVPTPFFRTAATPLFIQQRICQFDWVPTGCSSTEPANTPFLEDFHRKAEGTCATDSEGCTGSFGTTTAPQDPWVETSAAANGVSAVKGAAAPVAVAALANPTGGGTPVGNGPIFGGFHCDSCAYFHDSVMYVILPQDYQVGPNVKNTTRLMAGTTSYQVDLIPQGSTHVFAAPLTNPAGIVFDNDQVTSVY